MSILICAPFAPVTAWSQQLYIDTLLAVDYPREEIVVFIPMEADKCERCNRDDGGWEIWQPLLKFQRDYRKEFASIELDAWDSLGLQEMSLKGVAISVARNRAHYRVRRDPTITHICMLDSDVRPYDRPGCAGCSLISADGSTGCGLDSTHKAGPTAAWCPTVSTWCSPSTD